MCVGFGRRVLSPPPQKIDSNPLKHKAFGAGRVAVQAPEDFSGLPVVEQRRFYTPAFAFHRLTGEMQLRHRFRGA